LVQQGEAVSGQVVGVAARPSTDSYVGNSACRPRWQVDGGLGGDFGGIDAWYRVRVSMAERPRTRLGIITFAGHLGYELVAGVALPLAPHIGIRAAATAFALPAVTGYVAAGRLASPRGDRMSAIANGFFLAAVVGHYRSWPRVWRAGLPWLTECEGLRGPIIGPYNVLLQVSAVAGTAGLFENRSHWRSGAATALTVAPILRLATPREYVRLQQQAATNPRWWNRRLATRLAH
jgi:hypothetical protein